MTTPAPTSVSDDANAVCHRPGDGRAERDEDKRTEGVVRVHARELVGRNLLLHRNVPEDAEDLDAESSREGRERDHDRWGRHGEQEDRQCHREDRQRGDEQQPVRPISQCEHPAEDEACRLGGEDEAPRRGAAEIVVRHERPQHGRGADTGCVDEGELDDDPPEPGTRAERVPTLAQLAQEVPLGHRQVAGEPQRQEEGGADEVRRRVERERPARPDRRDQDSARRGTADLGAVTGQAQQRVRLL